MQITFITHYAKLYGANRSLLNLIDGLRTYGVQPSVVCRLEGPITEELAKRGIPFCVSRFHLWLNPPQSAHWLRGLARLLINFYKLPSLKRQVTRWRPDLIYSNSSVIPVGVFLAKMMKIPHVWHVREFAELHYQLRHDLGKPFFKFWLNRSNGVIAISRWVMDEVLGGVQTRIEIIPNGVISLHDLDNIPAREQKPSADRKFIFVIAGLIHPSKGQAEAIEALALVRCQHPEAELFIVGSGDAEYCQKLKVLAGALGVAEGMHFLGFVDDVFPILARADGVLMCSKYEAMGRITAEAMAAGRPVIGRKSGGTTEIIEDGITGLLYEKGADDLAQCMGRLIREPRLAYHFGKKARIKAREMYTVEACSGQVFSLLKFLVAS